MARTSMLKAEAAAEDKSNQIDLTPAVVKPLYAWISEDKLNETTPCVAKDGRVFLPGFGRPLNDMLELKTWALRHRDETSLLNRCPNPLEEWSPEPLTVRERNMMQVFNAITDKPDWRRKVLDETIIAKWRAEAITEEGQGFTEKMFDYCVAELQEKAGQHKENDLTAVLDSECAVVKSDSIISKDLKEELKVAVASLEDIPASAKDWHPGSNEQVLDLVHPSLFPLIYGRTRIIPTGTIGLDDCVQASGKGEIVPKPSEDDCRLGSKTHWLSNYGAGTTDYWSNRFQWLPSNVAFSDNDAVKIMSYINNLHPKHHKSVYPVIEKFIAKSIPAWDLVLSSYVVRNVNELRVPMTGTEYEFPLGEKAPEHVGSEFTQDDDEFYEVKEQWVQPFKLVDPTKPGHRKILALFLVDPFHRVISTANVPPQQREWWAEAVQGLEGKLDELPPELRHQVMTGVGDFPISLEEAKKLREELMDERRAFVRDVDNMYHRAYFSFCEH
ncbi:hypothetical protein KCU64_g1575, partial [Aureobasidium melanogenum]